MEWIVLGLVVVVLGVVIVDHVLTLREERAQRRRWPRPRPLSREALEAGLKGFPGDPVCQCYPEGRKDCPDHLDCRARLAGGA